MASQQGLLRKAHFLGTKIKSLRKRNHLTLADMLRINMTDNIFTAALIIIRFVSF